MVAEFPLLFHQLTRFSSEASGWTSREEEERDKAGLVFDRDAFGSTDTAAQKRLDGKEEKKQKKNKNSPSNDHGCSQRHRMHCWEVKCVLSVSPSCPGCCQSSRAVAAGSTLPAAAAVAAEPGGAEPTRRRTPGAWRSCGRPTCP